jgi:hypothetical protein
MRVHPIETSKSPSPYISTSSPPLSPTMVTQTIGPQLPTLEPHLNHTSETGFQVPEKYFLARQFAKNQALNFMPSEPFHTECPSFWGAERDVDVICWSARASLFGIPARRGICRAVIRRCSSGMDFFRIRKESWYWARPLLGNYWTLR